MALNQTQLFTPKKTKNSYSFNPSRTASVVASAYTKGIMKEKPIVKPQANLESALKTIFPEKHTENRIQKARQIMGDDILNLSDEEIDIFITEFQYLIDAWMDSFEKQIFANKTLKQLLKEG